MDAIAELECLGLVCLSGLLGGSVGFERELARRPAGLRTHVFVAASATILMLLGEGVVHAFEQRGIQSIRTDPLRVIEAVVVGVSFLGAGTIWRADGGRIKGLTTAASILMSAAIGLAVAAHHLVLALGAAVFAVLILRVVALLEVHWTHTKTRSTATAAGKRDLAD